VGSFKTSRLSTLLLLGLLAWIAYVLIAPEIDLEDVAFQRNGSPLAIHSLALHAPQAEMATSATRIVFPPADTSGLLLEIFFDRAVEAPASPPQILRC
jgi:hypothetical protein